MKSSVNRFMLLLVGVAFLTSTTIVHAQEENVHYTIQVGAFSNPDYTNFEKVAQLDYVYLEKVNAKVSRVLVGGYNDLATATGRLEMVKELGYKDAYLIRKELKAENKVYLVQLASDRPNEVEWAAYTAFTNTYAQNYKDRVRILLGPYNNIVSVNSALQTVRKQGFDDAFIQHIDKALVHRISPFEIEINETALQPVEEYEFVTKGGDNLNPFSNPQKGSSSKHTDLKRTSVENLQKTLSEAESYSGAADGVYDNTTKSALNSFISTNQEYRGLRESAKSVELTFQTKGLMDNFIEEVYVSPLKAEVGLENSEEPIAKAYLAYLYFTESIPIVKEEKSFWVNRLMNEAIAETFIDKLYKGSTKLDYKTTYMYDDINQLIMHIGYIHNASPEQYALPCWLFKKHPDAAFKLIEELDLPEVSNCGDFMAWEELKLLKKAAEELDPVPVFEKGEDSKYEQKAYDAKRTQLYLAPNSITEFEKEITSDWHSLLWTSIDNWANQSVFQKKKVTPLKIAYFDAFVLLENHYLDRGFSEYDARTLSLSVLRTVVNYHLAPYMDM